MVLEERAVSRIAVRRATLRRLAALKRFGESYDDLLNRLMDAVALLQAGIRRE
tara:strand:- start:1106 stop:1264 length:159 start_codon:yes stop_codon:yes gene_type:complete